MRNAETVVDVLRGRVPQHGHWRARCSETGTAGSSRGPLEKDPDHRYLASGLPVLHAIAGHP
jgi:hypothetical protein